MFHETPPAEASADANQAADGAYLYGASQDPEGASYDASYVSGYGYGQALAAGGYTAYAYEMSPGDGDGGGNTSLSYAEASAVQEGDAAAATIGYTGDGELGADGGGSGSAADAAAAAASAYEWPADPEAMLAMLQQQRQQYRSWVAQCAATALAALGSSYDLSNGASSYLGSDAAAAGVPASAILDDVPGLVAAMDVAGTVRQYMLSLKAAAEAVRDAARAGANFEALTLPESESYDNDPSYDVAAGEAAEAEFVSAAYGVTTAVAAARAQLVQLAEQAAGPAAGLTQEVLQQLQCQQQQQQGEGPSGSPWSGTGSGTAPGGGGGGGCGLLEAPLAERLERVGAGLYRRLRQEAEALMARIHWPPPLADEAGGAAGSEGAAAAAGGGGVGTAAGRETAFRGFELHPVQARRLVGVLTALTHYQMAVEHRTEFYALLSGAGPGAGQGSEADPGGSNSAEAEAGFGAKPLLWAAQALAEPVAAKLRAHFHPAAPTGRLDRPAWLYGTVLEFVRRHGHALASLDDMLACLQLKPHYNMPAEFARAIQEAVLDLLRNHRIPALLELRNQAAADADAAADEDSVAGGGASAAADAAEAEAEADALLMGLMDASAAYDVAMLPLLGATGPRAEGDAARALAMLSAAAAAGGAVLQRRRVCDQFDPTAVGTADMHARYVALAAAAAAGGGGKATAARASSSACLLAAWAAAEGAAALRAVEAVVYDESSLTPAEEAASRALGGGGGNDDYDDLPLSLSGPSPGARAPAGSGTQPGGGGGGGGPAPWQRVTWPPLLAKEAAALLDGLVARSKWLSADPVRQRDFLEVAGGPMLGLLRRRLGRLVDQAVARGEVVSEEGLPRVCAALCAVHFLDDRLQSLLLTDLAPLVQALNAAAAAAAAAASAAGDDAGSAPATPSSSFTAGGAGGGGGVPDGKLGAGAGGFWSGLIAAAAGGGGGGAAASPARLALRDGVTALAAGAVGAAASLASAAAGGPVAAAAAVPVLGEFVRSFARLHRDGCLKVARELALGFGRCSVAYRHAIEANPQFPFTPESDAEGDDVSVVSEGEGGGGMAAANGRGEGGGRGAFGLARPASSITPSFAPALLFLQTSLERLSRCCDKATFADVWRGAALSINRFMFNFIATESRFTRAGARQFAADVAGLAQLFTPYSRRGGAAAAAAVAPRPSSFSNGGPAAPALAGGAGGGQHFRELQAAARLLCLGDEAAADVMRRASAAAVAAQAAAAQAGGPPGQAGSRAPSSPAPAHPHPHSRGDPVRSGMAADPLLSSAGLACLSPLQIMNVIEHRI